MANRERDIQRIVRVSEEENEMINQNMLKIGTVNFSAYARKMLIDGYVVRHDFTELKGLTAELGKIGSNINQIAKRANETRNVYNEDIQDILRKLHEIKVLVNEKVGKLIK
ncbi:MAG: MobC family plasmid mobilization relaxosome protein [Clostridiaceae bacterium]|nr:MobC family plasmid mobilization relaxosome protein [Clostridiaceae bacterium]